MASQSRMNGAAMTGVLVARDPGGAPAGDLRSVDGASTCRHLRRTQSANVGFYRHAVALAVIERLHERGRHLVQDEAANQRPQDPERMDRQIACATG